MAVAAAITKKVSVPGAVLAVGTFTASSSYSTGGDSISWANAAGTTKAPLFVVASGKAGYVYEYDLANAKLMTFYGNYDAADGPLIEIPASTYPAGVSGDTITFFAVFPQFG